ncbi:hypothetical protein Q7P37_001360 [Cladosporium fusiforme]
MHQGLADEKGMAPAHDKAPGHATDSTVGRGDWRSPAIAAFAVDGDATATVEHEQYHEYLPAQDHLGPGQGGAACSISQIGMSSGLGLRPAQARHGRAADQQRHRHRRQTPALAPPASVDRPPRRCLASLGAITDEASEQTHARPRRPCAFTSPTRKQASKTRRQLRTELSSHEASGESWHLASCSIPPSLSFACPWYVPRLHFVTPRTIGGEVPLYPLVHAVCHMLKRVVKPTYDCGRTGGVLYATRMQSRCAQR